MGIGSPCSPIWNSHSARPSADPEQGRRARELRHRDRPRGHAGRDRRARTPAAPGGRGRLDRLRGAARDRRQRRRPRSTRCGSRWTTPTCPPTRPATRSATAWSRSRASGPGCAPTTGTPSSQTSNRRAPRSPFFVLPGPGCPPLPPAEQPSAEAPTRQCTRACRLCADLSPVRCRRAPPAATRLAADLAGPDVLGAVGAEARQAVRDRAAAPPAAALRRRRGSRPSAPAAGASSSSTGRISGS